MESTVDFREAAEAVGRVVDERGGAAKSTLRELLGVFDREKLESAEEAEQIQA